MNSGAFLKTTYLYRQPDFSQPASRVIFETWDGKKAFNWVGHLTPEEGAQINPQALAASFSDPGAGSILAHPQERLPNFLETWIDTSNGESHLDYLAKTPLEKLELRENEDGTVTLGNKTISLKIAPDTKQIKEVQYHYFDKNKRPFLFKKIIADDYRVHQGQLFPESIVVELYRPNGALSSREIYEISPQNLAATAPANIAQISQLRLPVGAAINDYVGKKQYTVLGYGGNLSQEEKVEQLLQSLVEQAQAQQEAR